MQGVLPAGPMIAARGKLQSTVVVLTALGCLTLPFTKALTLDVGFPLKLYEIFLPLALGFWLLEAPKIPRRLFTLGILPLLAFGVVTVTAYLIAVASQPYTQVSARGGFLIDGGLRLAYLCFHILILLMVATASWSSIRIWTTFWLWGAVLAAGYGIYCSLSLTFTGQAIRLPGIAEHQVGSLGPLLVSRSGTFGEGNFAGLYFLASLAIARYRRAHGFALIMLIALLLTKSTSAYLALGVMLSWQAVVSSSSRWRKALYLSSILVVLGVVLALAQAEGKFATGNAGSSAGMRINEAMTGFAMYQDHPWIGVGLGQYGYQFARYEWSPVLRNLVDVDRRIANNVYVELLAETGSVGTAFFLLFGAYWLSVLWKDAEIRRVFGAFAASLAVCWIGYPTFNITYVWCVVGISLAFTRYPGEAWMAVDATEIETRGLGNLHKA